MDFGQGALISGGMQMLGNYQNFKYQQKLAEQQNQYNIDMWKMQADYNSPQQQMERYRAAGLNPNLIYGQGSNGNMSVAPQMVTPNAPDFSDGMGQIGEGLGKLFNIENLRTIRANRKKAEAEATEAQVDAANAKDHRAAIHDFSMMYDFNPENGRFEFVNPDVTVTSRASRAQRRLERETGAISTRGYFFSQEKANDYTKRYLIPYRAKLLGSQNSYLQPQIMMSRYEQRYQPYSFWIGQGSKVLNSLPLPKFSFGRKNNDYNFNHNYKLIR
jgi:hypothetical protein